MRLMSSCLLVPLAFSLISRLSVAATGPALYPNGTYQTLQIMIVVPTAEQSYTGYCNHVLPRWERGEEILPGAYIAMNEINDSPVLLRDYWLEIVPIKIPLCSVTAKLDAFVGNLTSQTNNIVAVVGYFCDNLAQTFPRLIIGQNKFDVIQISSMPLYTSHSNQNTKDMPSNHIHYVLPSVDVYAKAIVMFIKALGWNKIGLINSGWYHDIHYSRIKEIFTSIAQEHSITTAICEETNPANSVNKIFKHLKNSKAKILVAFVPPFEALEIICEAHLEGFKWPHYVWLFVELSSDDMSKMSTKCSETTMILALENIIFLHLQQHEPQDTLSSGITYNTFMETYLHKLKESSSAECLQSNPYASILYDTTWTLAVAMNRSLNHSKTAIDKELRQVTFQGASGLLNYSKSGAVQNPSFGMFQIQKGDAVQISLFDSHHQHIILLNQTTLGKLPSDELDRVYILYPTYLLGILCLCFVCMILFTTVTMGLFVHCRNHPDIKATSSILSLCIFVGCYILIVSTLCHTIASSVVIEGDILRFLFCWGNDLLNNIGLDLVLATVFAKTLRIHHIFNKVGKVGSLWTDKCLYVLILIIVSVKGAIMILWIIADINYRIDEVRVPIQGFPPHQVVVQKCHSRYSIVWFVLTFGYSGVLGLLMMIVAVLTKNIKRERFKDSKKICALVAVLFMSYLAGCVLWLFLRETGAYIGSKVFADLAFYALPLTCQIFLFLPKIVPLLCNKLLPNNNTNTKTTTKSSVSTSKVLIRTDQEHTISTHYINNY